MMIEKFQPINVTVEEFNKILKEMGYKKEYKE